MGSRPGSIDPGVILWLQQQKGWTVERVEHFLYEDCGLKGMSGVSNDMRTLLASEAPLAKLAVEHFVYHVACTAGALAASMGGIDALVFTAGIGEHSAEIRARVLQRLEWLGFVLDAAANQAGGRDNITVVLLRLEELQPETAPPPEEGATIVGVPAVSVPRQPLDGATGTHPSLGATALSSAPAPPRTPGIQMSGSTANVMPS